MNFDNLQAFQNGSESETSQRDLQHQRYSRQNKLSNRNSGAQRSGHNKFKQSRPSNDQSVANMAGLPSDLGP